MPRPQRQYLDLSRPIRAFTFTVEAKEEGARLDALLRAHYPWHSRTFYRRKVERGEVLVNDRKGKASARLRAGDRVEIMLPEDPTAPERENDDDLVILYEDDELLAVDKPSGLSAHPGVADQYHHQTDKDDNHTDGDGEHGIEGADALDEPIENLLHAHHGAG